ncbi:MAG: c-type cytochrome [Gemmatimonadales bacterium]
MPDSFTNLRVLPKDIESRALLATMRGFALEVRCTYCHVAARDDAPLDSIDFAKDDKRTKKVARVMLDMVHHINHEHLADVPERPRPLLEVRCATCHRGVARPRLLEDDLTLALADSGLDHTVRRYRELRQRYYGSGSYDFGEDVVTDVALAEARGGRPVNAIGLLNLNAEFHPASARIALALGDVYLLRGDTATAIAQFRTALSRDSTLGFARQRLRRLSASEAGPPE